LKRAKSTLDSSFKNESTLKLSDCDVNSSIQGVGSNLTSESINKSIEAAVVAVPENPLKLKLKIKAPSPTPADQTTLFQMPEAVTPIERLLYYPSFFFEFIYNVLREPNGQDFEKIIGGKMNLDEVNLNSNSAFSKRTVLLYEKLKNDAKFEFKNFFTRRGLTIIERNYKLGTDLWICKLCFMDSDSNSIGCDHCNEWFHFQCINMKKIPKNEWFCRDCRAKKTNKRKSMRLF
jgi:hypothetical protein